MSEKYSRRKWLIGLWAVLVMLALPLLVQAGGWAVVTLETWPNEVVADRPFTVKFAVRQHGVHLLGGLSPLVSAVHPASGDRVTFEAVAAADEGYYQAELALPHVGQWRWQIDAFGYDHLMPPLQVEANGSPVVTTKQAAIPASLTFIMGIISLLAMVVALWAWWQQRTRLRLAFVAITAITTVLALALFWDSETAIAEQPTQAAAVSAEMGEVLFVAKGCVTCHQHDDVTLARNFAAIGPNLSHYVGSPEFLATWLKDPAALKPATQMPNLELKETEIQILIAFLSQPRDG